MMHRLKNKIAPFRGLKKDMNRDMKKKLNMDDTVRITPLLAVYSFGSAENNKTRR